MLIVSSGQVEFKAIPEPNLWVPETLDKVLNFTYYILTLRGLLMFSKTSAKSFTNICACKALQTFANVLFNDAGKADNMCATL